MRQRNLGGTSDSCENIDSPKKTRPNAMPYRPPTSSPSPAFDTVGDAQFVHAASGAAHLGGDPRAQPGLAGRCTASMTSAKAVSKRTSKRPRRKVLRSRVADADRVEESGPGGGSGAPPQDGFASVEPREDAVAVGLEQPFGAPGRRRLRAGRSDRRARGADRRKPGAPPSSHGIKGASGGRSRLVLEGDHVVDIEPDADAFADCMVVGGSRTSDSTRAPLARRRVRRMSAPRKALCSTSAFSGLRSSCTMSSGRSRTSTSARSSRQLLPPSPQNRGPAPSSTPSSICTRRSSSMWPSMKTPPAR